MPGKNEITVLRDQITDEVNRDAVVISGQLFGSSAANREPDMQRVPQEQLQALYRQKYLDQDRQWLQGEARRDPQQFMKVAREIGVVLPGELPGMEPMPNTLPLGPNGGPLAQPGVSPITAPPAAVPMPMAPGGPPAPVDPNLALMALQGAVAGPVAAAGPQPPPPTQPILQPPY